MKNYLINYLTGVIHTIEGDLNDAKDHALNHMEYTGEDVVILDADADKEITRSRWYGIDPYTSLGDLANAETEEGYAKEYPTLYDMYVLTDFNELGHYANWDDEETN